MLLAKEIRNYDSYEDLAIAHQKEVDNFPMCFMFGSKTTEQVENELEKSLGTRNLADVMKAPGCGGIIKKADEEFFDFMFIHQMHERKHFFDEEDRLVEAIKSEMYNHEYGYTQDPTDTLFALGKTTSAFLDEKFMRCWEKAKKQVLKGAA